MKRQQTAGQHYRTPYFDCQAKTPTKVTEKLSQKLTELLLIAENINKSTMQGITLQNESYHQ